jgi:type II secretory pathway component PulJ
MIYRRHLAQSGISLVELMIAMTLSLLIGLAVMKVFLGQKDTYVNQRDLDTVQEGARVAFEYLGQDLLNAGFWGCAAHLPIAGDGGALVQQGSLSLGEKGQLHLYSAAAGDPVRLGTGSGDGPIKLPGQGAVLVTDCQQLAVITTKASVPTSFAGALAYDLREVGYYLDGSTLVRSEATGTLPGSGGGSTEPVLEGVKDLQLAFARTKMQVLSEHDYRQPLPESLGFVDAATAATWSKAQWGSVNSVKVTLVLRGHELSDGDENRDAARLDRTFTQVFNLRNR